MGGTKILLFPPKICGRGMDAALVVGLSTKILCQFVKLENHWKMTGKLLEIDFDGVLKKKYNFGH